MSEDVGDLGPVDYSSKETPAKYKCGKCGATGIKLWRDYQTFLDSQSLRCASCACAEQSKDGKTFSIKQDENRRVCVTTTYDPEKQPQLAKMYDGSKDEGGDQIGWRVPAVPTESGDTYWGYSSVPQAGCLWWDNLPLDRKS